MDNKQLLEVLIKIKDKPNTFGYNSVKGLSKATNYPYLNIILILKELKKRDLIYIVKRNYYLTDKGREIKRNIV